jgi:hypothetical protein
MAVTQLNRARLRAILISQSAKSIWRGVPEMLGVSRPRWLLRWMFLGPDGDPHRAGEVVLADLRSFAGLDRPSIFDVDPCVMAFREGKRAVVLRIINYLNLDEKVVQKLMEIDDGLGTE